MQTDETSVLKQFSTTKFLLPVGIGLSVAAFMIWRNFDSNAFDKITWTWTSSLWIALAFVSVLVREMAYMMRIRILTDSHLSWYRSFIVIMLWECSSALAPGIIGGGFFFAIFILSREGVNVGRSISVITFSNFLDGVFLACMVPIVYWIAGADALFSGVQLQTGLGKSLYYSFWSVYYIMVAYKIFVAYALFVNPYLIKRMLAAVFSLPLLKRFRRGVIETGNQLIIASEDLKTKNLRYWTGALVTTFISWTARYSIVNCIIHAFHGTAPLADFVVYGKQVIMGIILFASPTPGGSGLAEFIFSDFLGQYIQVGLAPSLALLWRLISFYPYIIIGAVILPRWVRAKVFNKL
ncbi:MAG: flippase-like domain-containing protein [Bacteroidia bacterium]|nr:flippase-like domain-containing protein [Bacteroidia bacterium]HQV00976.1 lysylphosphatidylglycerol synthase transmembrane domain-containing protein [Bacteroidia bacterium]